MPVESPQLRPLAEQQQLSQPPSSSSSSSQQADSGGDMQLDDSKHKVYIYDLDAELSSDGEEGYSSGYSSSDEGKLVYLSDIGKHLRDARQPSRGGRGLPLPVPRPILPNQDGELAGMQVVLYREPKSLTVPEAQDSVRKAIVEARARLRRRQMGEDDDDDSAAPRSATTTTTTATPSSAPAAFMDLGGDAPSRRVPNGLNNLANDAAASIAGSDMVPMDAGSAWPGQINHDPDAMEMDID